MIKNYFKIVFRNIQRHPGYSFINIGGLAVCMACGLLILLWVQDELRFDDFHANSERLFRVVQEAEHSGRKVDLCRTPPNLQPVLKTDYPEIEAATRCFSSRIEFTYEMRRFEESVYLVDQDFLTMFSFPLIEGDPATALDEPNKVVMTQKTANKLFGDESPIGKIIQSGRGQDYQVSGVMADVPENSHLQFAYLISIEVFGEFSERMWSISNNPCFTYVMLSEHASVEAMDEKIAGVITEHAPQTKTRLYLQPFRKIHLYSDFTGDLPGHGNITYVMIFSIVAVFVIFIACINFMNLTTARSANRAREVGLRKVVGAERINLIRQFFGETLVLTFLALLGAVTLAQLLLPHFNTLAGKTLTLHLQNLVLIIGMVVIAFVTGIISGSYPALFLSSFQPALVLKSGGLSGLKGAGFRRTLVIIQFALSVILIIGTLTVYNQLQYIRNMKLGFDKENLVYFQMASALRDNYDAMKQELLNDPRILNVSFGSHILTDVTHVMGNISWEGKDPNIDVPMNCLLVDSDYVRTMNMEIIAGRDFSHEFTTDEDRAFILNEEAIRATGLEDPVGTKVSYGRIDGQIVGVVKDFHFKPLRKELEPMILMNSRQEMYYLFVRIGPGDVPGAIEAMRHIWGQYVPETAFEYSFLDESIDAMYREEERVGTLFNTFAILAIVISCLGLFGLASFMAERRTKEIGIRKVLGASFGSVVLNLTKEFTKWVLIANVIAWPVAYFLMNRWLANFAYRIDLGIGIFALSGLVALVIAWSTVSYQSAKAALNNPVEALKNE
jgi:ABC-type antimicrobial peptide transport system permease subunit